MSDKALAKFLSGFEISCDLESLVAQLVQEAFLVADKSEKRARFYILPDRVQPFTKFQPSLNYARAVLVSDNFSMLVSMARAAYRADDSDFSSIVVDLLSESELLDFLKIFISSRGDTMRTDGLDTLIYSDWARRNCKGMLMFLKDLLEPAISLPDAFELDEKRIRHASLAGGNTRNIENVCDQIIAAFISLPVKLCPPLILHLNKFLREQDHSANSNNALLLISVF